MEANSGETGRIEALETKVAYQDLTIAELDSEVAAQGKAIAKLESAMRKMADRLKELSEAKPALPQGERPPHY